VTAAQKAVGAIRGETVRTLPSYMAAGRPPENGDCGMPLHASSGVGFDWKVTFGTDPRVTGTPFSIDVTGTTSSRYPRSANPARRSPPMEYGGCPVLGSYSFGS